ncbi:hypothetical protein JCM1841_004662 [Sporobolomyces salmonicolor]
MQQPKPSNGQASPYERYDRLTPAFAKLNIDVYTAQRGSPHNHGADLRTAHPVIRTNRTTGWKGLFISSAFTKGIVELNADESDQVLQYLFCLCTNNHDLQVRFKWDINDVAIWSNAPALHNGGLYCSSFPSTPRCLSACPLIHRVAPQLPSITRAWRCARATNRIVSLGEKPYFDPSSKSRREALGLPAWISE